jgi:GTP pyrophosphokinase
MVTKNVSFDQVFDKFAIRIVYKSRDKDEKFLAWKIYSIVTDHYRPNPLRLRDWISSPKTTGYEALHITVMGPKGKWVEVQIRSERMHEIAEKGYAAHFKYKQGNEDEKGLEIWLNRLQDALENPQQNAVDFVEEFKLNLYSTEIFVFTPNGDLKSLPSGSTPIDFAFSIHTEIGMHTRGAKVNGKIVPLSRVLKSGDQVEIITSEKSRPTANWLDYSQTGRARSKIRSSLSAEKKLLAEEGKEQLRRKLKQLKFKLDERTINDLVVFFGLNTSLDLYYRVQIGTIDNVKLKKFAASKGNRFLNFFKSRPQEKKNVEQIHREEITANYDQLVFTKNEDKLDYSFSNCCNPIAGDDVFGFITVNEGIKVHKKQCPNALSLQSKFAYRIVSAKWIDSSQENFVVDLKITGIDYVGMVNEITQIISNNLNVNIKKMAFSTDDGTFKGALSVEVKNKTFLKRLMKNIENISGVEKVVRD